MKLRDFFDLALQGHVGLLQILNVLVLHLVHVDDLENLRVVGENKSVTVIGSTTSHWLQSIKEWMLLSRIVFLHSSFLLVWESNICWVWGSSCWFCFKQRWKVLILSLLLQRITCRFSWWTWVRLRTLIVHLDRHPNFFLVRLSLLFSFHTSLSSIFFALNSLSHHFTHQVLQLEV